MNREDLIGKIVRITVPSGRVTVGKCLNIIKGKHIWIQYESGIETGFTFSDGIKVEVIQGTGAINK